MGGCRRPRLVVPGPAPLLPARREHQRNQPPRPRNIRRGADREAAQPEICDRSILAGGGRGWHPARRHQLRVALRRERDDGHPVPWRPREHRRRLPETREGAPEPAHDHLSTRHPRALRGEARDRRRIPTRRTDAHGPRQARSRALRWCREHPATATTVGNRRPRPARPARGRRARELTRSRRESARPFTLRADHRDTRRHPLQRTQHPAGARLPAAAAGDADLQRRRSLRVHPHRPGTRPPGHRADLRTGRLRQ